jgi:hypothetical protein
MRRWLLVALAGSAAVLAVRADEPPQADRDDACLMLNNRILGPRAADRPLPLLSGDSTRGFRAACAVPWSTLSPRNQSLPIVGCFHGSLLQVANDTACGNSTGPLWVSARWVVTSADLEHREKLVAVCQQLETGAWAGTRDFHLDCKPRKKELSAAEPEAKDSRPSTPPPAPSRDPSHE